MIGASLKIDGKITSEENLVIEGTVKGSITAKNSEVVVGASGSLTANILAKIVRVEGTVKGDISGGENVYPAEIENVIYQLPQVGEVAIIGVSDDRWGEVGQAIIVIKPEQTLDEQTVLKHCSDKLAKFKQPQSVRFIDEIPHNATGKVLKRELRLQS